MEDNVFIPKKIRVGFQERQDTYTKKLAYVIYYDEKNKIRKENSWESWRDKKISPIDFDNSPVSGFVLNKKVGGYKSDWNFRNAYVRVYDPRDFEFEITIPNLLFILENTSSIKGKGLEGEFVYGWKGADLILIPTSSPNFVELSKINDLKHNNNYIKSKELILGATYRHRTNVNMFYMGRFDLYETGSWKKENGKNKGLHYYFIIQENKQIRTFKTLGNAFIELVDNNCTSEYAKLFETIECRDCYSPIDESKTKYIAYSLTELIKNNQKDFWKKVFFESNGIYNEGTISRNQFSQMSYSVSCYSQGQKYKNIINKNFNSIEDLTKELIVYYQKKYLLNGKLYSNSF